LEHTTHSITINLILCTAHVYRQAELILDPAYIIALVQFSFRVSVRKAGLKILTTTEKWDSSGRWPTWRKISSI